MTNIKKSLILSAIIATIATVMVGAIAPTLQSANAQDEEDYKVPVDGTDTKVKAKIKQKQDCEQAGCQQSACVIANVQTANNNCRLQD
jgi:hypothetical protein